MASRASWLFQAYRELVSDGRTTAKEAETRLQEMYPHLDVAGLLGATGNDDMNALLRTRLGQRRDRTEVDMFRTNPEPATTPEAVDMNAAIRRR